MKPTKDSDKGGHDHGAAHRSLDYEPNRTNNGELTTAGGHHPLKVARSPPPPGHSILRSFHAGPGNRISTDLGLLPLSVAIKKKSQKRAFLPQTGDCPNVRTMFSPSWLFPVSKPPVSPWLSSGEVLRVQEKGVGSYAPPCPPRRPGGGVASWPWPLPWPGGTSTPTP